MPDGTTGRGVDAGSIIAPSVRRFTVAIKYVKIKAPAVPANIA